MTMTPWIGAANPRDLTPADFDRAAARIGCDAAAIRAIWEVEASGQCFTSSGAVLSRFEPHQFPRQHWPAMGFAPREGQAPWRASLAVAEASRSAMFRIAASLDLDAALSASSWGGPQIMGFNHAAAGFDTAAEMVAALATGAPAHLAAFVALVTAWGLDSAIRAQDWLTFAARYNGTGQPEVYAARIETAFRRHSGTPSPVVLRIGDRGPAVSVLQRALRVPDDGAFGPGTLDAVLAFQAAQGLPIDGVVGARTWAALDVAAPVATAPVPAQASTAESRLDTAARFAQFAAPAAVAAPLVTTLQGVVPPILWQVAMWVAFGLVLLWIAPWVARRIRRARA